jgi:hypothetical protein
MCRTCSEPMRHLFGNDASHITCEMRCSRIFQHILDSLRMVTVACYLVSGSCVSFIRDFGSITMLFSGTLISGV